MNKLFLSLILIISGLSYSYEKWDYFPDSSNKDEVVLTQVRIDEETSLVNTTTLLVGYSYLNFQRLGQGFGKLIEWNPSTKKGLFKLINQKAYHPSERIGAMWYDVIVNEKGEVLQLLEPNSKYLTNECIKLSDILTGESYPLLNQSMDDCIRVII
jgi:hypothetical protein